MIQIGDATYIIDLEAMSNTLMVDKDYSNKKVVETETIIKTDVNGVETKEVKTIKTDKPKEYDSSKYDVVRVLFEVLLSFNDEIDDTLGLDRALSNAPMPFKITFNTLLNYGILKEI